MRSGGEGVRQPTGDSPVGRLSSGYYRPARSILGRNSLVLWRFPVSIGARSVFCLLLIAPGVRGHIPEVAENGDAALSSETPHIPEPMVFDLVRPLGVQRGEFETNVLAGHDLRSGETEWAPELEYAIRDGLAVEVELPFENLSVAEYKLAVQGTLGTLSGHRYIHGWQIIGRHDRHHGNFSADALYLAGYRWNHAISTFNMAGLRWCGFEHCDKFAGILNTNLFFNLSDRWTLGVELDNQIGSRWGYLLMPQLHLDFTDHVTLQFGAGPARLEGKHTQWTAVWRMIFAF